MPTLQSSEMRRNSREKTFCS